MKRRELLQAIALGSAGAALPSRDLLAGTLSKKRRSVRFAQISDIHVKSGDIPEKGMANALHSVQQLRPQVDFVMNTGDCIWDALEADKQKTQQQFDLYKTILKKENGLPIHYAIGNHDVWGWFIAGDESAKQDKLYGKAWVVETFEMPKRYYHFNQNKWHFIVLDSTQLNPAGGYIGKLDEEQFEWLQQELSRVPMDEFVCIVSHIPILSICAGLFFDKTEPNGDLKIQRNLMHTDFLQIKKLFFQYPQVRVCISGHIHLQDELEYLGVKYWCNGAVSGNWWKGSFQEFAPAYAVIELYDDGTSQREIRPYS